MTKPYLSSVIYYQCFLSETPVLFDQVDEENKSKNYIQIKT